MSWDSLTFSNDCPILCQTTVDMGGKLRVPVLVKKVKKGTPFRFWCALGVRVPRQAKEVPLVLLRMSTLAYNLGL